MKALRNATLISLAVAALALVAVAPVAYAEATAFYTATVPLQGTELNGVDATPAVPLFDSTLGTLDWVKITVSGSSLMTIDFTNTSATQGDSVVVGGVSNLYVGSTNSGINTLLGNYTLAPCPGNGFCAQLTGSFNKNAQNVAAGVEQDFGPFGLSGNYYSTFSNLSDIANFVGVGTYDFTFTTTTGTSLYNTGGSYTATENANDSGSITVEYDYTPPPSDTPEPGTLTLFGSGLLGLAGMLRRKYMLSR